MIHYYTKALGLPFLLALAVTYKAGAQSGSPRSVRQGLSWLRYEERVGLTPYWRAALELEDRRFGFTAPDHQFHVRLRLLYLLSPKLSIGVGGSHFSSPSDTARTLDDPPTGEWRVHQELTLRNVRRKWAYLAQLRIEERFFQKNPDFGLGSFYNYRLRYRVEFSYVIIQPPSKAAETLRLKAGSELMLNGRKGVVSNAFNQARLQAGLHYQISKSLATEALYLKVFHLRNGGNQIWNRDVLRIALLHEWNLKSALKPRKSEWLRMHQERHVPEGNEGIMDPM